MLKGFLLVFVGSDFVPDCLGDIKDFDFD